MSEIICPYCNHEQEPCCDDHETGVIHEIECANCHKIFGYEIEYYPVYTERKLPCANGQPHEFKGKVYSTFTYRYCVYCGKKEII